MLSTELNSIELAADFYNLFSANDFEETIDALEEALRRRSSDAFIDDRWQVAAEELRELRRRGYEPVDKETLEPALDLKDEDEFDQEGLETSVVEPRQEELPA